MQRSDWWFQTVPRMVPGWTSSGWPRTGLRNWKMGMCCGLLMWRDMFLDSIEMLQARIDAGLGWSSISCLGRWLLCKLGYSEIMVAHSSSRFYFETIPIWLSMAIIFLTLFVWAQKELLLSKGQSRMAFLGTEGISSCFASHCKALVPKWELYFPLNPPWSVKLWCQFRGICLTKSALLLAESQLLLIKSCSHHVTHHDPNQHQPYLGVFENWVRRFTSGLPIKMIY